MNIVVALQIVTVIISVFSIIINVFLTIRENNVKHFLHYTTGFRINNLINVRKKMISLLNLTNPIIIDSYGMDEYKDYLTAVFDSSTEIELIFKDIYEEELEMVRLIRNLVNLSQQYFTNRTNDVLKRSIIDIRNKLKYLYSIYETTDWEFIKKQTRGHIMDNKEFLETYDVYKHKFEGLKRAKHKRVKYKEKKK